MKLELSDVCKILDDVLAEEWLNDDLLKKCEYNVNEAVAYAIHKIRSRISMDNLKKEREDLCVK